MLLILLIKASVKKSAISNLIRSQNVMKTSLYYYLSLEDTSKLNLMSLGWNLVSSFNVSHMFGIGELNLIV